MQENFNFTFTTMGTEFIFGAGSISKLNDIMNKHKDPRILIITDKNLVKAGLVKKVQEQLDKYKNIIIYDKIEQDPRLSAVTEGVKFVRENGISNIIAIGGGSVIDAAKCLASVSNNEGNPEDYWFKGRVLTNPKLPLIAIPTTAGTGSEVTKFAVVTHDETKQKTGMGNNILVPDIALLDPELTIGMPPRITASTGLDALTHAVESYVNLNVNVFTDMLAVKAMKLIGEGLRPAVAKGDNIEARSKMLLGSMLAGWSFGNGYLGLVHALAHPLGGHYGVPHGIGCGILLPKIMKYNLNGNLERYKEVAEFLGERVEGLTLREAAHKSVEAVENLLADIGIESDFKSYKIDKNDIPIFVREAYQNRNVNVNPRRATPEELAAIIEELI